MDELREKIAAHYMIQCQNSKDFECPHLDTCLHEDKDICQWQLDCADELLSLIKSAGYIKVQGEPPILSDEEIAFKRVGLVLAELESEGK
jgi:hypothetical protein